MAFSENVLVLRTGRFKEYDVWVRFLSPSRGILSGFAFGGCRSRRRFCGCLDSLNLVRFTVSGHSLRKKYLTLEEGTLICGFNGLKKRADKLGMAVNCLRFVQQICLEGDDSAAIYQLTLASLQTLDENLHVPAFFPLLFKAKAAFIHGYEPTLNICARCACPLEQMSRPFFLFASGHVICSSCIHKDDRTLQTGRKSLLFLDRLRVCGPEKWVNWDPEQEILQDCFRIVDSYVQYHLE